MRFDARFQELAGRPSRSALRRAEGEYEVSELATEADAPGEVSDGVSPEQNKAAADVLASVLKPSLPAQSEHDERSVQ